MIRSLVYDEQGTEGMDDPGRAKRAPGRTWVRVTDPDETERSSIEDTFDIHQLSFEDVLVGDGRPKVEEFEGYTLVLMNTAELRPGEVAFPEELAVQTVGIFIGPDWVLTISPRSTDAVEAVWTAVMAEEKRLLSRGADFMAYRILQAIVDEYFDILEDIETQIERIEDTVIESPDAGTLERINELRRDLLSVRRLLWPSRDAVSVLARGDPEQIRPETEKYYRDVYDSLVQLVDLTETYRDLVVGTREIYLNSLSTSTNEVMKQLTVVATIVMPLTFVAGIYGMNFSDSPFNMPELQWTFGYPAVLLGMAGIAVVMIWHFRRKEWL
jgi:magnesium transporter